MATYNHTRVIGSLCYAHTLGKGGDKFASRSRRCVFVSYPHGKKGWKLYDLDTKDYFVSRDVVFHEGVFLFAEQTQDNTLTSTPLVEIMVHDFATDDNNEAKG